MSERDEAHFKLVKSMANGEVMTCLGPAERLALRTVLSMLERARSQAVPKGRELSCTHYFEPHQSCPICDDVPAQPEALDTASEIARLRAELAATKKLNDEYYSTLLKRKEEHKALIKARQDDLDEIIRLSDERDQLKAQLAGATKPAPEFFERKWRDKQWQVDSAYDAGKWAWDLAWAECARRMTKT